MPTTLMDGDRATLWYHPEPGIVHHHFKRPVRGKDFREVLLAGLDVMKERGATRWLSDDRNNSALTPEDSVWAEDVWSEEAVAVGWRYWAIVLPEHVVGKMDMARYIARGRGKGVNVRVFSDPDVALEWLSSDDPEPYPLPDEESRRGRSRQPA